MQRPPCRFRSFLIERRLSLSLSFSLVFSISSLRTAGLLHLGRTVLSLVPPASTTLSVLYLFPPRRQRWFPAAAFGHAVLVGRCTAPLGSVPSLLPSIPPPPRCVLIICHATLALQANSHWFPFLSWPALICDATAVPLTRLIGHCPLSFQLLPLPLSLSFSFTLSV